MRKVNSELLTRVKLRQRIAADSSAPQLGPIG